MDSSLNLTDKASSSTTLVADSSDKSNALNQHESLFDKETVMAKRPSTVAETGLSEQLLLQLLLKHMLISHVVSIRQLAEKMALSGGIIQSLLEHAKILNWLENRQSSASGQMRLCP